MTGGGLCAVNLTDKANVPGWLDWRTINTCQRQDFNQIPKKSNSAGIFSKEKCLKNLRLAPDAAAVGRLQSAGSLAGTKADGCGSAVPAAKYLPPAEFHPMTDVPVTRPSRRLTSATADPDMTSAKTILHRMRHLRTQSERRMHRLSASPVAEGSCSNRSESNPNPKRNCSTSKHTRKER